MEEPLLLFVEVPICAFRPYASREYQDTYPIPTPSSVYGMLLSLVGISREDHALHRGVAVALALEKHAGKSRVFRKLRRGKDLESTRPDYQDLLIDVRLWVWLKAGHDSASPTLPQKVTQALSNPRSISRFGGLSLGESSYLVNSIAIVVTPPTKGVFLSPDKHGFYSLPVWVDHQNSSETQTMRFSLIPHEEKVSIEDCWAYLE